MRCLLRKVIWFVCVFCWNEPIKPVGLIVCFLWILAVRFVSSTKNPCWKTLFHAPFCGVMYDLCERFFIMVCTLVMASLSLSSCSWTWWFCFRLISEEPFDLLLLMCARSAVCVMLTGKCYVMVSRGIRFVVIDLGCIGLLELRASSTLVKCESAWFCWPYCWNYASTRWVDCACYD